MADTTAMLQSVILYKKKKNDIAFIETDAAFLAALLLYIQWCETTAALGMTSMTLHTGTLWAFFWGGGGGQKKKITTPLPHVNTL